MGTSPRMLWPESVSAVTATKSADIPLGAVRYEDDATYGYREYQYVYNSGGEQINPTYGCKQSALTAYSVTVTATSQLHVGFGLVVNATLTTGTYGWVLKRGVATFIADTAQSFSINDGICLSTDGKFGPASAISGQSSDVGILNVCGVALSAVASGATGMGYFHFL